MKFSSEIYPSTWGSSLFIAAVAHLLIAGFMIFGPGMPLQSPRVREVKLIRLSGGGENIPGWIKPTTAPSDDAIVPDNKPKQQTKTPGGTHLAGAEKPADEADQTILSDTKETGGVGAKPGPEGPGWGIKSDADFPGGDAYLSRIEAEVQRRFNFRGRGGGAMAEYHFFIEKNGKSRELVLMKSSDIASLDLTARSAITRAKFPPLPAGFRHKRLGITFRFYDAK